MISAELLEQTVKHNVATALIEDIGSGDITASLIAKDTPAEAQVISREQAVICGRPWVDEVFRQIDPSVRIEWQIDEGSQVIPDQVLFKVSGPARSLLTAERCALNFLQTLSGTATRCRYYADLVNGTQVKLLDTRKTLPGLRVAQKYAVTQGGCYNHRIGLYDAFLIKENHIAACGSIVEAIEQARLLSPGKPVEVEVESLGELEQALAARANTIMLDNFSLEDLRRGVTMTNGRAKLEASGGVNSTSLSNIAKTGVDYVSIGALTKDCQSIDLSMRFK